MIKQNLMNNTNIRRKGSMLKDSISKIKYLLVLALLLGTSIYSANAGADGPFAIQTDDAHRRQTYFWDLRERESFLQLTNTSSSDICVHVQIFNVNGQTACEEVNFVDCYTGNDTHVYDVRNLTKNDGGPAPSPDLTDGYGFATMSITQASLNALSTANVRARILIGMFRIVDDAGYEYRTNSAVAGTEEDEDEDDRILTFNDINGNDLSDVVGISFIRVNRDTVYASPSLGDIWGGSTDDDDEVKIWDEFENPQSCSPVTFSCNPGQFIYGLDNSLPASKGGNRICNSSVLNANNTAGWLNLDWRTRFCLNSDPTLSSIGDCDSDTGTQDSGERRFIGYIGLNNGDGTGSMDSWFTEE